MNHQKHATDDTLKRLDIVLASYHGDKSIARKGLTNGDPKIRSTALLALFKIGSLTQDELISGLCDPEGLVRRTSCEIAANYSNLSLENSLADDDPFVVEMALWALGEREDAAQLEKICEIARNHPESLVREAAIASIGAIGDPSGLEIVLASFSDRPNVRRRAVVALAAFEGPAVTEALERATHDRDWQVRQIAEDLLQITEDSTAD